MLLTHQIGRISMRAMLLAMAAGLTGCTSYLAPIKGVPGAASVDKKSDVEIDATFIFSNYDQNSYGRGVIEIPAIRTELSRPIYPSNSINISPSGTTAT